MLPGDTVGLEEIEAVFLEHPAGRVEPGADRYPGFCFEFCLFG